MSNSKTKKILSAILGLAVAATATAGGINLASNNGFDVNGIVANADTQINNTITEADANVYYIGTPAEGAAATGESADDPMSFSEFSSLSRKLVPGDIVYVMPGVHKLYYTLKIGEASEGVLGTPISGTHENYIIFKAYDETQETVLDFSAQKFDSTNRGVQIYGNYYYWYGIDICGAGDNGLYIGGSYNVVENCEFYNNRDTGLQLGRNYSENTSINQWPSYNLIKNCTSHNNYDNETYGENADGFAAKLTVGYGNMFDGCIAYRNSDDGWDLYGKSDTGIIGSVIMYNCVAFENGFLEKTQAENNEFFGENFNAEYSEENTNSYMTRDGDGNGFKLGGSTLEGDVFLYNCLSFNNRMHGVTDNSNPGVISVTNVTSYNNSALVDNDPASATFGQILALGSADHNNIDMARDESSYNNFTKVLSVVNGSGGVDRFKGSASDNLFANGTKWNKISGYIDADSIGGKVGESVNAAAATDIFAALPAADFGVSGADLHSILRNEDGSVNMGDILKIKDYSLLLGADNTVGADLSQTNEAAYTHPEYTYLTDDAITSDEIAKAEAVKNILYIPAKLDAVYQDFQLITNLNGYNITWESSDDTLVQIGTEVSTSVSGTTKVTATVYRDIAEDKNVTLTATIGDNLATKTFDLVVKQNEYIIGDVLVEGVENDKLIVDQFSMTAEPSFSVTNAADYNGKLIPAEAYTVETTYMYSAVKGGAMTQVKGFTSSNAGVYEITKTIIYGEDSKSYTYTVYVVSGNADVDFVAPASIGVTYNGFSIVGELNNVSGTLYALASTTQPTVAEMKLNGQAYKITSDIINVQFEADNSSAYTVYYMVCNPNGTVTSEIYSQAIETVEISTREAFADLANNGGDSSKIYKLTTDLDFTGYNWTVAEKSFSALLDGQGHTISNISATSTEDGLASVFYRLEDGSVMNITFKNITLNGAQNVGIFGSAYGGYIGNVKLENISVAAATRAGGLIGRLYEQPGMDLIIDRVSLINDDDHVLTATGSRVGGLIGFAQSNKTPKAFKINVTISNCYVDAIIGNAKQDENGGIFGTWDDAYNSNVIMSLTIDKCVFVGTVMADSRCGGIIAYQKGIMSVMVTNCVSMGDIYHAGSETPIQVAEKNASGIFGGYSSNAPTRVVNCYSKFEEHNANFIVNIIINDNLKTEDFWKISLGFDIDNVWEFDANTAPYCTLR